MTIVDVLAEKLDARLREWKPETAAEARERTPSSSSPAMTLTHRDLSFCTCLSRHSGETVRMKFRYRGFRSLIVNPLPMFKD